MMVSGMDNEEESAPFPVTNGVKQGCVLAPTLFSMVFSAMLTDAFQSCNEGILLRYRTDGGIFNLRRLRAVTKVKEVMIRDFLFADDCALNASTEAAMQHETDCFSKACDNFGLTISTKKTEVMYQPAPGKQYTAPSITVKGHQLQAVETFTYLGSTLSRSANIDAEVNNRIAKASASFGRLRENVWERRGIRRSTKLKVYHAVILTTLLYASETWTVYSRHARRLNHFHLSCLRRILQIKWQDKIPDTKVLEIAKLPSIHTLLIKSQARWAGHVARMTNERLPKQLFYGELSQGKRAVGGQKKRFRDSLKKNLIGLNIDPETWERAAQDRTRWRSLVSTGCKDFEKERIAATKEKRRKRKERECSNSSTAPDIKCRVCGKTFMAKIGLTGHARTHKT